MSYRIKEQFLQGKMGAEDSCEDFIVVDDNIIAVIDGATDKSGRKFKGVSSGRFAAETIANVLPSISKNITTPIELVQKMTVYLKQAIFDELEEGANQNIDFPSLSFVAYLPEYENIVRVGDCPFMLDGLLNDGGKLIDYVSSMARANYIEAGILSNEFLEEGLYEEDYGRDFIMPILKKQFLFANNTDSQFGYGVVNGASVPEQFVELFSTKNAEHIVLASDGYPELKPTLESSEQALTKVLKEDPLLFREYPSTKGLQHGQVSYDDRAYISFTI